MEGVGLVFGTLILVVQTAGALWIGWRLACRWWADDLFAVVCSALILSTSFVVVVLEVLGSVGLVNRGAPVVATLAACAAVARYVPRVVPAELERMAWRRPRTLPDRGLAAGVLLTTAMLIGSILVSVERWRPSFDSLTAHLPIATQFIQRHDTWFFPYASPVAFSAHYPANAELLAAWVLAPLSRDVYVQLAGVPGLALLIVATAMLARTLGARTWSAIGVALLLPAMPRSLVEQVGTNMQDLLTTGAVVALFAFAARRWARRGPAGPDLVLGGLAAGMALGTRYGALLLVAPALVLLVLPSLLPGGGRRLDVRTAARHSAVVIGAMVAVGGYFYVRNQVFGGSPVYPESVPWKSIHATERINFPLISTYLELGWQPATWRRALGDVWRYDGAVPLLLVCAALALPLVAFVRRERTLRGWLWALAPLTMVLAFLVTPAAPGVVIDGKAEPLTQALNLRYGIAVVPVAAAALAAELRRWSVRTDRLVVGALLLVGVATSLVKAELPVPWRWPLASGLLALGAVALAAVVLQRVPRSAAAALVGAALLVGAVATPRLADHLDEGRVTSGMPGEAQRLALADVDGPIAVAGFCQIYGLYGPDLRRDVEYLTGDDDGIDRPMAATEDEWLASLQRHHVRALVLGSDICYSELDLPYEAWVASRPDVFEPVGPVDVMSAYLVHLPTDPG
jgi:hypothetical protein